VEVGDVMKQKLIPHEVYLFFKGQLQYATVIYERGPYFAAKVGALMLVGAGGPILIDVDSVLPKGTDAPNCKFKFKVMNNAKPPCPAKTGWRVEARPRI